MAGKLRIFLDANILFSACRSDGAIRKLLQRLEEDGHALMADSYVTEEARRNLLAKAPADASLVLQALEARLEVAPAQTGRLDPELDLSWLESKDQPVLLAAIALRSDVLVTGDKAHFGPAYGHAFRGVLVCPPALLFEYIQS